jgi:site-specific DNA-methyltransferase (adenine-specific)
VDLIFADPPYFLSNGGITCQSGRMVSVHKGAWDASRGAEENHAFNRSWLAACQRVLKPGGTIFVSGTQHVIFSVGFAMQQLGFKLLNDISWFKVTPPPNLCCRYFTHATETILWAARDARAKHFFAYQDMKAENGGKQMQSLWSLRPPLKAEKRFGRHPTQKPLALLERIVRAASRPDDQVLDPFNGSGTTGIACARLGRRYVGIDMDAQYLDLAVKRFFDLDGEVAVVRGTSPKKRGQAKAG